MKYFICFLVLILISMSASAGFVKCYSSGKLIYNAPDRDVLVGEGFIINKNTYFSDYLMADCVVRYTPVAAKRRHKTVYDR